VVNVDHEYSERLFDLSVETCNPTDDWRPVWMGFLAFMNKFEKADRP
jgi:hypothetical protein